jgi:hypothetical protein
MTLPRATYERAVVVDDNVEHIDVRRRQTRLAHAMMTAARGAPVVEEQHR